MGKASTLTVRSVTAEDDLLWERGLSKSAQGTWMQRLAYLRAVGRHLGPVEILAVVHNAQFIAGVAGLTEVNGPERRFRTIYLTGYHGLWVADAGLQPHTRESLMEDVAQALTAHLDAHWTRWAFASAPELVDMRPFSDADCRVEVNFTYRIDLDAEDAMLARLEKEARREIRHAGQTGVTVAVCEPTGDDLLAFGETMNSVAQRQGAGWGQAAVALAIDVARDATAAGCGQLFLARSPGGRVASALLAAWDAHRAYLVLGGGHPEETRTGATRLLHWRAMQWLRERGHREVDLLGANYRNHRTHKRRWNGRLVPYFTVAGGRGTPLGRRAHLTAAAKHLLRALRGPAR